MELEIYPRLCRESKLAMRRRRWRYGNVYRYEPRSHLVRRLAEELGKTEEWVRDKIQAERKFLLEYPQYAFV